MPHSQLQLPTWASCVVGNMLIIQTPIVTIDLQEYAPEMNRNWEVIVSVADHIPPGYVVQSCEKHVYQHLCLVVLTMVPNGDLDIVCRD